MKRLHLYAVELEVFREGVLAEQTTAHVHAASGDEAVAQARRGRSGRVRVVAIDRGFEPGDDLGVGASPLEPRPTLGARARAHR